MKWIPRSKSGASKSRPRWAAHTRIGNVWEYPPAPPGLNIRLCVFHLVQCQVQSKDRLKMTTRFICYFIYLHLPHRINMTERRGKDIYLSGFHTRCLYWVSRWSSPRSHCSPSPPMRLMTSQSLPPSSASSVMIMSHRIDLAGLGHRKNSLTLRCFLT